MEEKIISGASVNASSEEAAELSLMTASNTASTTDSATENEESTVSQGESGNIGNFGTYKVDTVSGRKEDCHTKKFVIKYRGIFAGEVK